MKIIGLIFFLAMFVYGTCYTLPIKIRLLKKLDKTFSREKIKELAEMGEPDARKIIKSEKIILVLGLIAVVLLFLSSLVGR